MLVNDTELDKDLVYFMCAYYFGWTEKEVNETKAYRIENILTILPLWIKKTNEIKEDRR